jgi:hypothetical protein
MTEAFMTDAWAQAAREIINGWPDEAEQLDERKADSYWAYFTRKRDSFDGVLALGASDLPGETGSRYLALTFDADGSCSRAAILPEPQALASAKIAIEGTYQTWCDLASGYDIGKAMTYHMLPLRVGGSVDLLRCVYFVHEIIVATLRVDAGLPAPAAA